MCENRTTTYRPSICGCPLLSRFQSCVDSVVVSLAPPLWFFQENIKMSINENRSGHDLEIFSPRKTASKTISKKISGGNIRTKMAIFPDNLIIYRPCNRAYKNRNRAWPVHKHYLYLHELLPSIPPLPLHIRRHI